MEEKLRRHATHVSANGAHCSTEETTKQALILPLLDILGFSPFDPLKVRAEYAANLPGIKTGERVDYALFSNGTPCMFVEAKPYSAKLTNHGSQLARYFNATPGVKVAVLTNGREWRFYTDLRQTNIMDSAPFYTVDFLNLNAADTEQIGRFHHDKFQPDSLRGFAETQHYLTQFRRVIETSLREVDAEFVRYVAIRANLEAKLTARFLETIAPIVRQATAEALSGMVITGMNAPTEETEEGDIVDSANPKIVTTAEERKLLAIVRELLASVVDPQDITGKDTESYYAILYRGKVNRWLLRYGGSRAAPQIWLPYALDESDDDVLASIGMKRGTGNSIQIEKPEHVARLFAHLHAALDWCRNDDNFSRVKGES